ncbi:hypothetical protein TELCIR_06374 [Teladorsagia circumcincta]|uniref:Protein kinase domain-containing protein n=1 Tax=Teladorsagia circumcincta TaxID=45464 RepID=A0A2G9UQH0_TELCI|nr:hypothetical protein TELCIR_06374 [Teladorsagia circumcincta]
MTEVAAPPLASEVELQGNLSAISTIAENPSSESTRTNSQRMWVINDFEIGRPLGKGHFGFIFLARYKPERVVVSLKVLSKDHISKHNVKHQVKREIQIHYRLRHPNILRLKNYFHDERRVYIILECANGGDLYSRLKKKGRLEEPEAARYLLGIQHLVLLIIW